MHILKCSKHVMINSIFALEDVVIFIRSKYNSWKSEQNLSCDYWKVILGIVFKIRGQLYYFIFLNTGELPEVHMQKPAKNTANETTA